MKLKGAVVGVGYLGTFHAQKYKKLISENFSTKLEFIGVCDSNFEQAKKVAADLSVQAFNNVSDLIGKVDFVTIATVTSTHFELAKFFLSNGIHVNVEKPMTKDASEAKILVDLAKQKGLVLCVGHSERFNPAFRELDSKTTNPSMVELSRHAPYKSRGADVSVVHDLMIHDVDLALSLNATNATNAKSSNLKCEVISASGGKVISTTLDWAMATLKFSNGFMAQISVSRLAPTMTRTIRLIEDKNIFEVNLQNGDFTLSTYKDIQTPAELKTINLGKGDGLLLESEAFFYAILAEKEPAISGLQGLKAMEVIDQIIAKIEQQ